MLLPVDCDCINKCGAAPFNVNDAIDGDSDVCDNENGDVGLLSSSISLLLLLLLLSNDNIDYNSHII